MKAKTDTRLFDAYERTKDKLKELTPIEYRNKSLVA